MSHMPAPQGSTNIIPQSPWEPHGSYLNTITKTAELVNVTLGVRPTADTAVSPTGSTWIATIPTGYTPGISQIVGCACVIITSGTTYQAGTAWVESGGVVKVRAFSPVTVTAASGAIFFTLTYRAA